METAWIPVGNSFRDAAHALARTTALNATEILNLIFFELVLNSTCNYGIEFSRKNVADFPKPLYKKHCVCSTNISDQQSMLSGWTIKSHLQGRKYEVSAFWIRTSGRDNLPPLSISKFVSCGLLPQINCIKQPLGT